MGKALYRKYRPKTLDDVIGQEHITDTLKNAVTNNSISHAYLFTGPRGTGKTSIARILAHLVNGIDYIDESMHLDIIEIDAASNRKIEEIRNLREKVHIAPTTAKYKVYIIDEVHMLTREAFNALLKTLEEPPEHVIFILATTEAHKVPDTIISRTQRFSFKPIALDTMIDQLKKLSKKEKLKISDGAVKLIAEHGQGSFRDSISILDQLTGLGRDEYTEEDVMLLLGLPPKELISDLVTLLTHNNIGELFDKVTKLKEQGVDSGKATQSLCYELRNELMTGNLNIPRKTIIKLLQDLLPLTNSSNDYLGLELCMLDAIETGIEPIVGRASSDNKKGLNNLQTDSSSDLSDSRQDPKIQEKFVEPKEQSTLEIVEVAKKTDNLEEIASESSTQPWQMLLEDLKKSHNTLYGVLRMAKTEQSKDKFSLIFRFGFHKKQVENPKNYIFFKDKMKKYFGSIEIETTVDKTLDETELVITETTKNEAIKSVSNIFNGAELLKS